MSGVTEVRIVREQYGGVDGWSIYDGQEWFAHTTMIAGALRYASDLLHGPGVGPRGFVWNAMRDIEIAADKRRAEG